MHLPSSGSMGPESTRADGPTRLERESSLALKILPLFAKGLSNHESTRQLIGQTHREHFQRLEMGVLLEWDG